MTERPAVGLVYGQPDPEYRAADGAHYSAIKHILDCPARYLHEKYHRVEKAAWDFGHVVHGRVLGVGDPLHVLDANDWRKTATKDEADAARAAGKVPLLRKDYDRAVACSDAILRHRLAGGVLTDPDGHSEVSIYWIDEETGIPCKARIDRVVVKNRHHLVDVKTMSENADPYRFGRTAVKWGYHIQSALYLDGYCAATGTHPDDVSWWNVIAEVNAPHLVSVPELDGPSLDAGRYRYRQALRLLKNCLDTGEWPGYDEDEPVLCSVPQWEINAARNTEYDTTGYDLEDIA